MKLSFFDDEYLDFHNYLLENHEKLYVIQNAGGLRKIRIADSERNKGKRGGARVIYYYFLDGAQIWLFSAYGKGEKADLNESEKRAFKVVLENLKAMARGKE